VRALCHTGGALSVADSRVQRVFKILKETRVFTHFFTRIRPGIPRTIIASQQERASRKRAEKNCRRRRTGTHWI
jgi:hypothetical protein